MRKGPTDAYSVQAACSWLRELGHARYELRTGGEPAILAFTNAVKSKMEYGVDYDNVLVQAAPRHSHQSQGSVERAIQTIRGLSRVVLDTVKSKVNIEITGASIWWSWALRHAMWLYNRFHKVRYTRRTPYLA